MREAESDMIGVAIWLAAVLGAATLMVSPITPWLVPVEVIGAVTCVVATAALVLRVVRR